MKSILIGWKKKNHEREYREQHPYSFLEENKVEEIKQEEFEYEYHLEIKFLLELMNMKY